jgi:hypothetical protein
MMRSFTSTMMILAACGRSAAPPPAPPSSRAEPIRDPVVAAEAAIRNDMPLDYELPFADRSERRAHRVRTSVAACDAGHKPSCWKALQMAPETERPELAKRVETNCRSGDLMSCRALPMSPEARYPDLPGAVGRSAPCEEPGPACDLTGLRAECTAGFPRSCSALREYERAESLTAAGCDGWILDECTPYPADRAEQLRRGAKECELIGSCNTVGRWALDEGRLVEARDAYERTCQYTEGHFRWKPCLSLGMSYLDHRFPEPVPGRGQALLDWSCHLAEQGLDKGDSIGDLISPCKRMTPHH